MMFGSLVAGAVAAALTGRVLWGGAVWLLVYVWVTWRRTAAAPAEPPPAVVGYVREASGRVRPWTTLTRFGPLDSGPPKALGATRPRLRRRR